MNNESVDIYPVKGQCQCGQVTFSLKAAPKMVIACHCKECQKLSTSAFSITTIVEASNIEINGVLHDSSRVADSGSVNVGKFCPGCGNRIYQINPVAPEMIKFKAAGGLDNTSMIIPNMHVWTREKQTWFTIPEGVQQFEKQR
ncbi:GFA family protein [Vibrio sp. S11_S32]|uniref:GFA family protein n=1 Tax=Vibrio sp. S11_S32 TaxID=2720225 RepID=UPI0016802171|nr:GFA family protein [Vibrio sp. S11_S32]MBD1577131.1 GFA family protein [Vibrio sp. S11_S32]